MKIFLKTLILLLLNHFSYGQSSDFKDGYKEGYKEGYCYQEYGCISPIPPIPPLPEINESKTSYKDGYNRGFLFGQKVKQEEKNKNQINAQKSNRNPEWARTDYQPMVDDNFVKLYMQQIEIKKARQQQEMARMLEAEKIEQENEILRAKSMTTQTLNTYNSYTSKPLQIPDGWHNVVALDRIDFCENRLVRVQKNQIVEYFVEPYKWDDKSAEKKILTGGTINGGKTLIKTLSYDETNESNASYIEIYFIDYLINPDSRGQTPIVSGKISFWSDKKNGGTIFIKFNETVDKITSYFKDGKPSCNSSGTCTFEVEPGIYQYIAFTKSKKLWNGTVTITSGNCLIFQLK